jgi:hypothetical protein
MSSLSKCLRQVGLGEHEAAVLRGAAKDYTDDGYKPFEAAQKAVSDYIAELEAEARDLIAQVEKQLTGDFALESPTPESLAQRADTALAAKTKQEEADKRAAAPQPSEFKLSGSDSKADQAIAAGQQELVPPDMPEPTEKQKEAGNYKKWHIKVAGLNISIENPAGTERSGTSRDGKAWSNTMQSHYGYILGTDARDGDHVDVFVEAMTTEGYSGPVFVVDQINEDGLFDEHKVMIGWDTVADAREAYLANYDKGWKGLGAITRMPMADFKEWVAAGKHNLPMNRQKVRVTAPPAEPPTITQKAEAALKQGGYGKGNKVFTAEKAEAAREILRRKLGGGQLNAGIDPEVIKAGIDLAGFHIEAGARSFKDFAKAMVTDLGDFVKPHLKGWYLAVKNYPEFDAEGMDRTGDVEDADLAEVLGESPADTIGRYAEQIAARLMDEKREGFASITDARKVVATLMGKKMILPGTALAKQADEIIELGVVMAAREIVGSYDHVERDGGDYMPSPADMFDRLVTLYDRQPKLAVRTSTSVEQQAYSTPAPLAYVASQLVRAGNGQQTVYEPTAGNGMLLIEVNPRNAIVNELNPARARALEALRFKVTQNDATEFRPKQEPDVIIANPPFGVVRGANGDSKQFKVGELETTEIDHAISLQALSTLPKNGRAALILGGINKLARTAQARQDAYNGKAKRNFYFRLYQNYNVTDHFTVAGELYEKQGAGWPVDVIIINGKGKSALDLPSVTAPRVYSDWASLKELLDGQKRSVVAADKQQGTDGPVGDPPSGGDSADVGGLPGPAGDPVSGVDRPADGSAGGDGRRSGDSGEVGGVPGGRDGGRGGRGGRADLQQPGDTGVPVVDGARAGAVPGDGQQRDGGNGADARQAAAGQAAASGNASASPELGTNANQVAYQPTSKVGVIGTLVPVNMQSAVREALANLEGQVGALDTFVAKELGYKPDTIVNFFGAEQIDALALALHSMKHGSGFIIGDQTGIGKGRVVAGVIRWALKNGKTPIFVTEKPNLYGDMYRDLVDIGMTDIRPVMTNQSDVVPLTDDGNVVLRPLPRHNEKLQGMANDGNLGDHNIIFTTYNQMQFLKGEQTVRNTFLSSFANGGVVIFDESHNAGGQTAQRARGKGADKQDAGEKQGRAAFARAIAGAADAVFYSSATWAKRPEVMDLYFKTDMAKAVKGNIKELPGAIEAGGVPLQQVVSAMLTQAGQYIRRERSFNGVTYNTVETPVARESAELISQAMMGIAEFDRLKKDAVKAISKEIRKEGEALGMDSAVGAGGATSTNFTSIMHNLIDQMLLSLKADAAANRAIERAKAGEKVVVTVANTMGSFISDYAEQIGLSPGDAVGLSFQDLLIRYLERSRDVLIKPPGNGPTRRRRMTDEELGQTALAQYNKVAKLIRAADAIAAAPVSPIDYMHAKMQAAGLRTGEITGRNHIINYAAKTPTYEARKKGEGSIAGRRKTIAGFNNGELDVIILNQAGSTGLSLHASSKFKDQRPRRMIIAQPEKNIDTHMQMLGRVHRTGQVVLPAYDQLVADIPAEKRPAAVLARKMASLSANTTANRKSALASETVVDFLNAYGDEVVAQLMDDMPDVHRALGKPLTADGDTLDRSNAAAKVTGRIPLLPVGRQEEIYHLIETTYQEAIERADALGENALEAKTLDLDAKPVSKIEFVPGDGSGSPFGEGAFAETLDVKRLGKPYTSAQVLAALRQELKAPDGATPLQLAALGREQANQTIKTVNSDFALFKTDEVANAETPEAVRGIETRLDGLHQRWNALMRSLHVGAPFRLQMTDGSTVMGVVTAIKKKAGVKTPVALGAWQAQIALADSTRSITIPFSKLTLGSEEGKIGLDSRDKDPMTGETVWEAFDSGQTQSREKRVVMTGNLLAAFSKIPKGQIVNFQDHDGGMRQGVLMARNFDLKAAAQDLAVDLTTDQAIAFINVRPQIYAVTSDGAMRVAMRNESLLFIRAPKSKSEGGKYFLDKKLLAAIGEDFTSSGESMSVTAPVSRAPAIIDRLTEIAGAPMQAVAWKDEARRVGGRSALDDKAAKPAFKRGGGSGMDQAAVKRSIDKLTAKWANAPKVNVLKSFADAPEAVRAYDTAGAKPPMGFLWGGEVYVVADQVGSEADVATVIFHEALGHVGLRGVFGKDLDAVLKGIILTRPAETRAKAKEYKLDWAKEDDRLTAAEEVLAELAETNPQLGIVQRAIAAVRTFLRKIGLNLAVSDAEIIRDFIIPAREWVQRGGKPAAHGARPAFIRAPGAQWDTPQPSRMDNLRHEIQDKHIDTLRVVQAVEKVLGRQIDDKFDPRLAETLYAGRADDQIKTFLRDEVQPMLKEMAENKVSLKELGDYLHARHAEEANDYIASINSHMPDGGSGLKTAEARRRLQAIPADRLRVLRSLAAHTDLITRGTRQLLVQSGLESQETVDKWERQFKHYIPLQREDVEEVGMGTGQGFSTRGAATRERTGSDKNVIDVIANVIAQRERQIDRAEKNKVATAVYGLAVSQPNPDFWLPINPLVVDRMTQARFDELVDELTDMGLDPLDAFNILKQPTKQVKDRKTGKVVSKINPLIKNAHNVVVIRHDGKERYVFFNRKDPRAMRMAEALKNHDADKLNWLMAQFAKVSRYFAAINTAWNVAFAPYNFARDFSASLVNLSSTPLAGKQGQVMKHTGPALAGIYKALREHRAGKDATSTYGKIFEDMTRQGGRTAFRDMYGTSEDRAKKVESEIARFTEGPAKRSLRAVAEWVLDYNDTAENALRVAVYKTGIDNGLTKARAAEIAKGITVNFNRKGARSLQFGALFAFFNASVQGNTRMFQTFAGPAGVKIALGGVALGAMQALALMAAGFDDDEPAGWIKERSLIIPTGVGKKYVAVPLPLGLHVLPNMGRVGTEIAITGGKNAGKKMMDLLATFVGAFNPVGGTGMSMQTFLPTAFDIPAALFENKDFAGRDIARKDFSGLRETPGHARAMDSASDISTVISRAINSMTGGTEYTKGGLSPTPDQLDYIFGQITGGVGRELLKVYQSVQSFRTGEDLPTYKHPLTGRLYGDAGDAASISRRYFDNVKNANDHVAEGKGRARDGGDVKGFLKSTPEAELAPKLIKAERALAKKRAEEREKREKDPVEAKRLREDIRQKMINANAAIKERRASP